MAETEDMTVGGAASFWLRHADKAVTTPIRAKITGHLPSWLHGNLYRNGAAVKEIGPDRFNHLFDGLACVHKFNIDGARGQVTYQNRFLESDEYRADMAAGRIEVSTFGTLGRQDLCRSLFGRLMSTFRDLRGRGSATDNCSVNVGYFGTELYAMTETSKIWRLNQEDLGAEKQVDLSKVVAVNQATAHPHVDPDGTVYNVGSSFTGRTPSVNVIQFPASGSPVAETGRVVGTIPHRWPMEPSYFHSFGITENYFVFVQQPLVIQVKKLVTLKLMKRPVTDAITEKAAEGTWIRLVDRRTGELHQTLFKADTFYAFHHVNAYEEDGHVVVDICAQLPGKCSIMDAAAVKHMSSNESSGVDGPMLRFVLPLEPKSDVSPETNLVSLPDETATAYPRPDQSVYCVPRTLNPPEYRTLDLPRINYEYNGHKYRYAYTCRFVRAVGNSERLVKLDVQTGASCCWYDPSWTPSEPVFVRQPGATSEDSGLILASLLHVTEPRRTALVVLNAETMEELARAEVETDAVIAKDFHGLFAAVSEAVHRF
ncbi:carotenoid isomerooxygenase-like isoform X1 [Amphibalanus amphitrite]|uniref:carotenoid isomerooxygenase-like isoform X1 n=3 Tax=Amphibalanus amphitrite TaxID=1232801 RepID=UPI001C9031F4|nr:carotenoid isomerooxygenase-like isoform X1 [Amphibalanus amphitrite]